MAQFTNTTTAPAIGNAIMQAEVADLIEILTWARPDESKEEAQFVSLFVDPLAHLPDVTSHRIDGAGNRWFTVGEPEASRLLFSCHTDTVHAKGGRQEIQWQADGETLELKKRKPGRCLGADDGAGIYILRRMMAAGIHGTYVFHRGEEVGRLGSRWVAKNEPELLERFDACIAFDRRDTGDIITFQSGERTASDSFADSLADQLGIYGLYYQADPTGSYTDSYSYRGIISECTNLSVGYDREHGPMETLNAAHAWQLANALCKLDWGKLDISRDPSRIEYDTYSFGYGGRGYGNVTSLYGRNSDIQSPSGLWQHNDDYDDRWQDTPYGDEVDTLVRLCRLFPEAAAELLDQCGLGVGDFVENMRGFEQEQAMQEAQV